MTIITAFFDANVLHSAAVRDVLMELAFHDVIRGRWSADVHREWMTSVKRRLPDIDMSALERTREAMDGAVDGGLVTDYEHRIEGLHLPDMNDRHVLAAAIETGAAVIVTNNLRDFPAATLMPFGIVAESADTFLLRILEEDREGVVRAVGAIRQRLSRPARSVEEYLARLRASGLERMASELAAIADRL